MIAVLSGGVGAARLLTGLVQLDAEVVAIVNTGDDLELHGLSISPDLDTITYTLAGAINPATGWGLVDETWHTMAALKRFETVRPAASRAATTWFGLGDSDIATHLYRSHRLAEGATLTTVTTEIVRAWGLPVTLLPMSNDRVSTRVTIDEGEISFQEYFVERRHCVAVRSVRFAGAETAAVTAEVIDALRSAERIVIAPSNPIVSIGPLLALEPIRSLLIDRRTDVVAVSPIIAGAALKGPADRLLAELGHEPSVVGVAKIYSRYASTLVIDDADAASAAAIESAGMRPVVTDTIMRDRHVARALAETVALR